MITDSGLDRVRAVADAVLYEGYLLYPYRSTSAKNQVRWQFGVLGPPGACAAGVGEEPDMAIQCLCRPRAPGTAGRAGTAAGLRIRLRFLQLQGRQVEQASDGAGEGRAFVPVERLERAGTSWVSWDEAVEREVTLGPVDLRPGASLTLPVEVEGGEDVEPIIDVGQRTVGRLVRRRVPLTATVDVQVERAGEGGLLRAGVAVRNTTTGPAPDRGAATARSFLGAHLLLEADGAGFVSVIDPPDAAREAALGCVQHRCWPVLAGEPGDTGVVLGSPIILYDYPEVAPESPGALFDATEIDEILTLRVLTLTDEEKAAARATDGHAAAILDRIEQLSPADFQRMHGALRDPRTGPAPDRGADVTPPDPPAFDVPIWTTPSDSTVPRSDREVPWWDPGADASVRPESDGVVVAGVEVRRGSRVVLRPNRRADAQDLFFAGQPARVTAVLGDVDGDTHVAVVLENDPAAEIHDWYGRYLYFAPEELEPVEGEESRS